MLVRLVAALTLAAVALAKPLVIRDNQLVCDTNAPVGDVLAACPDAAQFGPLLAAFAADPEAYTYNVLPQLNAVLSTTKSSTTVKKLVAQGPLIGVADPIVSYLKQVNGLVKEDPNCRCPLITCGTDIQAARNQCELGNNDNGASLPACTDVETACGEFYSPAQIKALTGCCGTAKAAL